MVESRMSEDRKPITAEGWKAFEKALSGFIGLAEMLVDGRIVTFHRGMLGKNKLAIAMGVDGKVQIGWCAPEGENEHPERKYLRPSSRFVWSAASKKKMKKMPKKHLKVIGADPDERRVVYDLIWSSASTIKKHYVKTFENICLLKINEKPVDENGKEMDSAIKSRNDGNM